MKKIIIFLLPVVLMTSCVKSLDDYNIDQKRATGNVPSATLLTNAELRLSYIMTQPSVNYNIFRFFVQHWTTTTYLDEPRYDITTRNIPENFWTVIYKDVLGDLNEARRLLNQDQFINAKIKANQLAQIEILQVYAWSVLVNSFGNIPYSEALDINNTQAKYDDAATVYNDLLNRLDVAINDLDADYAGVEDADLIYGGDIDSWFKFGNSLKFKLGMILADADPTKAKSIVESAAPEAFTSEADNAIFPFQNTPPNNNPISDNLNPSLTNRRDYVAANTLVDVMNSLNDPRRAFYFTTVTVDGQAVYRGGTYGFSNSYANFSKINPTIYALDFEAILLDYSEMEFFRAEAVERGFNVGGGSAQEHYNNAITASIQYWQGIYGTSIDISAYLARPDVTYSSAGSGANWRQKIGKQKWIALYNRGYDSWTEWRRLDYPVLTPPLPDLNIPVRLSYPTGEQTLNNASYQQAVAAMGGDTPLIKLFWDKN